MAGFYMFEGSFFQGGGGWEHIEIRGDLAGIRSAVRGYVREGSWAMGIPGETCRLGVYGSGALQWERELYPHIRVKVPGLTEVRFGPDGERIGGLPEPGGEYGHLDETALWNDTQIAGEIAQLGTRDPGRIIVDVDWDAIAVPEPADPVLGGDSDVVLSEDTGRYAVIGPSATVGDLRRAWAELSARDSDWPADQLDDLSESDRLPEDLRTELIEELESAGGGRLLTYGYNSLFDPFA